MIAVCTGIRKLERIHSYGAELGIGGQHLDECLGLREHFRRVLTLRNHLLQRVEDDASLHFLGGYTLLFEIRSQDLSQFDGVARTGGEVQFYTVQIDAIE